MAEKKQNIVWTQVVISALLTAFLSFAVGIGIFHYTSKAPELTYTTFPVSGFKAPNKNLTIYNVQIENNGNKEAEKVQVSFTFPYGANIADYNLDPSAKTIKPSISDANDLKNAVFEFPLLNPTESCKFSFLAENAQTGNVEVDLRGKGVIGEIHKIKSEKPRSFMYVLLPLILSFLGVFLGYLFAKENIGDTQQRKEFIQQLIEKTISDSLDKEGK